MFGQSSNEQRTTNKLSPTTNPASSIEPIFGKPLPDASLTPRSKYMKLSEQRQKTPSGENRNNASRAGSHDGRVSSKSHGADVMMHEESKGPPVSTIFFARLFCLKDFLYGYHANEIQLNLCNNNN